jgi:phage-related protein
MWHNGSVAAPIAEKVVVWLHGEVKTPPFSAAARREAGGLLGLLQRGELIGMPSSRPMPSIGARCHELRVNDEDQTWRIVYRIDSDAIVVLEVFSKKNRATPKRVVDACQERIKRYDEAVKE